MTNTGVRRPENKAKCCDVTCATCTQCMAHIDPSRHHVLTRLTILVHLGYISPSQHSDLSGLKWLVRERQYIYNAPYHKQLSRESLGRLYLIFIYCIHLLYRKTNKENRCMLDLLVEDSNNNAIKILPSSFFSCNYCNDLLTIWCYCKNHCGFKAWQ